MGGFIFSNANKPVGFTMNGAAMANEVAIDSLTNFLLFIDFMVI